MVFISVKEYKAIVRLLRARYDNLIRELHSTQRIVAEREQELIICMAEILHLMHKRAVIQKKLQELQSEIKAQEMEKLKLITKMGRKISEEEFENKEVEIEITNEKDKINEGDNEECDECPEQTPKKMKFQ